MKDKELKSNVVPYFIETYQGIEVEDFYGDGDSMYPILKDGDKVYLQRIPYNDLESGMIVIYQIDQFVKVCHVLIRFEDDGWVARGVNNSFEDSTLVKESNYIGVLTK